MNQVALEAHLVRFALVALLDQPVQLRLAALEVPNHLAGPENQQTQDFLEFQALQVFLVGPVVLAAQLAQEGQPVQLPPGAR